MADAFGLMKIAERFIGPGHAPYVIAELGVNHDGSARRALALVDAAADAGADAVKVQWFEARRLLSAAAGLAAYQRAAGEQDPLDMLRRLELAPDAMPAVVDRAHARGLHAIVTVFNLELVANADRLPWDAYKSASPDIINRPLLGALAATGRPLIVSTGAADLAEIAVAADWLRHAADRLVLLHCVSCYPAPAEWASLPAMSDLARLGGAPIGYSDHTAEVDTGALAVTQGACVLEKHLTYDRAARGPDHAASLDPDQLAEYVRLARAAHRGHFRADPADPRLRIGRKQVLPVEEDVRTTSRQSVTAARPIRAGQRIQRADLTIKRPGIGLPPRMLDQVVGMTAARDIRADQPLCPADLAGLPLEAAA
jgi:N-acetylneuraminate synthase/N,N'-diacetyllegionaminate synthase